MPILKTSHYDVLIVGAGVNGCASAYFLSRAGLRVALIDRSGIAAGGSGAAGAFISPKFSKSGPLKEIMSQAHAEALDFYSRNFPDFTLLRPLLHIANSPAESEKLSAFKQTTELSYSELPDSLRNCILPEALENESIYLDQGAIVDAQGVCRAMVEGIDFFHHDAQAPVLSEGVWQIGELRGIHLILATGAYPKLLPSDTVKLRSIWGHRIDIRTSSDIPAILHHYVSISPTNSDGIVAIGATHDVHYNPFSNQPYDIEAGRSVLLDRASKTLKLNNINIVRDFTGLRSGTHDYYPIAGNLIDESATLDQYEKTGIKPDIHSCVYYPNAWMINGSGGYGFVLAPHLARRLSEHITGIREIAPELSPARFIVRQLKR